MTREDLIYKTKVKIEELSPYNDGSFINKDDLVKPITAYIDDLMNETCNEVLLQVPRYKVRTSDFSKQTPVLTSDKTGYVLLPNDFLKLHSFRMVSWKKDVNAAISSDNALYVIQGNPYTMGNPSKPVCAVNVIDGRKVLEYYSVPKYIKHEISKAQYIATFNSNNIQEDLADLFTLRLAGKVYGVMSKTDAKKLIDDEYALALQSLII